jgi:hypothetical protein
MEGAKAEATRQEHLDKIHARTHRIKQEAGGGEGGDQWKGAGPRVVHNDIGGGTGADILYAAPQAHSIINVALHWDYSPGIVFLFSQGKKDLYHV